MQLTKHMQQMMIDHAPGPRSVHVLDSRHVTILALVSRGLLRFVDQRRSTIPTAAGWPVVRKLLAAHADEFTENETLQ